MDFTLTSLGTWENCSNARGKISIAAELMLSKEHLGAMMKWMKSKQK
jgi:hypothetical protein